MDTKDVLWSQSIRRSIFFSFHISSIPVNLSVYIALEKVTDSHEDASLGDDGLAIFLRPRSPTLRSRNPRVW